MSTLDCSHDFNLPSTRLFTENERAWIGFLRQVSGNSDPGPTLHLVQTLRQAVLEAERQGERVGQKRQLRAIARPGET